MGEVKPASYYDEIFRVGIGYSLSHDEAPWAPLWNWIADRAPMKRRILDFGCGPGHLAALLIERGFDPDKFAGIDFSGIALAQARQRAPGALFEIDTLPDCVDLLTRIWAPAAVVFCEVLEHLEEDRACLQQLPPEMLVLTTVPMLDSASHVRAFGDTSQVRRRYGLLIDIEECEQVGTHHFGFSGHRRP